MESLLRYLIDHFPDLMNLNLTASFIILFVICVRQCMKRLPNFFLCIVGNCSAAPAGTLFRRKPRELCAGTAGIFHHGGSK